MAKVKLTEKQIAEVLKHLQVVDRTIQFTAVMEPEHYDKARQAISSIIKIFTDPRTEKEQAQIDTYGERLQELVNEQSDWHREASVMRVAQKQGVNWDELVRLRER